MVAESQRHASRRPSDALRPSDGVVQLVEGAWLSRAIHVVVSLAIPDLLSDGPRAADELAAETSTHAPAVERIMRALAGEGLFERDAAGRYSLTDAGALLRRDAPDSLHPWVLLMLGEVHQGAWADLMHTARTGESAFRYRYGMDLWEYCASHPEHARLFAGAMAGFTSTYIRGLLDSYSFAAFESVVDVGGGDGRLLVEILRTNAHARGVLFDRPEAVVRAEQRIAEAGIGDRCHAQAGDALVEVPGGGDAYVLSRVLHDWDDDAARRILVNCREAAAGGRILVIERVMPDSGEERAAMSSHTLADVHLTDLNMMVMTTGRERSLHEYERLFAQAGLGLDRAVATRAAVKVLEVSVGALHSSRRRPVADPPRDPSDVNRSRRAAQRSRLRELLGARPRRPILAANVNDQQDLRAAVEAADQAQSPMILMVSLNSIEHSGMATIAQLFRSLTEHRTLPVWLQLDHACDLPLIKQCIAVGFDIVMADYSREPLAENMRNVREVVQLARAADVLVEGEVGTIPDDGAFGRAGDGLTTPDEARDFAAKTAVDFLAVSVGNSHGFARMKPRLDLDRIRAIGGATSTPLVLHGGDYYSGEAIAQAVKAGMTKVNFGPELREAYCGALRSGVEACDWHAPDHRPILNAARTAVRDALLRRFSDLDAAADEVGPPG